MRRIISSLFILYSSVLVLSARTSTNESVRLFQIDPLQKVFKENIYLVDNVDTIRVARGGYASIQIVAKSFADIKDMGIIVGDISDDSGNRLKDATAGWVGYVNIGRTYNNPGPDNLCSLSGYYPDAIYTDTLVTVGNCEVQPLWITVPIPTDAAPGIYRGTVTVNGKVGKKTGSWNKDFFIRVYPATLSDSPLKSCIWSGHFNTVLLKHINGGEPVEYYSPLYWELMDVHARIMREHRQNAHRIYPSWHARYTYDNGKYTFDFSRFDQEVELFDKYGKLALIIGGHLAWRESHWKSDFYVEIPLPDNDETRKLRPGVRPQKVEDGLRFVKLPVTDERVQTYLNQFLPALKEHLEQKGWLDRYVQHIGDEPIPENAESYKQIADYVHRHMPGVRLIDAVLTSKDIDGAIDIWVPLLDILHREHSFYKNLKNEGKEVWMYVCTNPRGKYANRFVEQPLIKTRYLHWINFKYDIPGYLHWGLNSWDYPETAGMSRDRDKLPAGDATIVYPGYRKLYSSIRFEAQRDGIDDYQLLMMLKEKDSKAAYRLVNDIILDFNEYDGSIPYFRKIHKRLLEAVSY